MGSKSLLFLAAAVAALLLPAGGASAQSVDSGWAADPPGLHALVEFGRDQSDLRVAVERYVRDRQVLFRRYDIPYSELRRDRLLREDT